MVQTVGVGTAIDAAFTAINAGGATVSEVAEAVASAASISRLLFPLLLLSALDVILASSLLFWALIEVVSIASTLLLSSEFRGCSCCSEAETEGGGGGSEGGCVGCVAPCKNFNKLNFIKVSFLFKYYENFQFIKTKRVWHYENQNGLDDKFLVNLILENLFYCEKHSFMRTLEICFEFLVKKS